MGQGTVKESVVKTNKVIVLHEDSITGGIGAEISAWISKLFRKPRRSCPQSRGLDTPIPFRKELEDNFMPLIDLTDRYQSY